jgi:uncharacterized protein (UPF0332 family)
MQEFSERFGENLLNDIFNLFVLPEIKRRKETNSLPEPFVLKRAQIIFYPDGKRKNEIRLNSEVKVLADMKIKGGISKKKGEPIYENEVEGLKGLRLTDKDDPDCGHITLVDIFNKWIIAFDLRYNKALAKKHVESAKHFHELAQFAFNKEYYASCLDCLFSAAELASKATLLPMADAKFRKRATHYVIYSKYNQFADLGNVDPVFRETLNKLSSLRARARYFADVPIVPEEIKTFLENVNNMIADAESWLT